MTTEKEIRKIAAEVALCASTWDSEVRLLGNATAGEIGRLCSYVDGLDGTLKSMEQTRNALLKKLDNYDDNLTAEQRKTEKLQTKLTEQDKLLEVMGEALDIANRCIENGDLILVGSAYHRIIKQELAQYQSYKAWRE